jgi:hypothetical protein
VEEVGMRVGMSVVMVVVGILLVDSVDLVGEVDLTSCLVWIEGYDGD